MIKRKPKNPNAIKKGSRAGIVAINVIAAIVVIFFLFPLLWTLVSSFKGPDELFNYPPTFWPQDFTFENYKKTIESLDIFRYFFNTVFVTIVATCLTILISSMAGFSLAKYQYKFMTFIFIMLMTMQMLPTEVIMQPAFQVIVELGLYDRLLGIIVPTINTMTGIFLMRQFFLTVPNEVIESARMDGAKEFFIFRKLMFPMAKNAIAILAIFSVQWRWNDYLWPLIVISTPSNYTLQLMLQNLVGEFYIDWTMLLPACVLVMLPTVIVFVVFQKFIMQSIAGTGSKES